MTLGKQLWLVISLLLVSAFAGSFIFSSLSTRNYVEQQLAVKNTDTANALALTISHYEKEEALVATFLATQFDMGHFQHISLTPVSGEPFVFEAGSGSASAGAPDWFKALFPLSSPKATARVMDGWREYGVLQVASDKESAYQLLWSNVQKTLMWLLTLIVFVAIAARYLVRTITRPLDGVVKQAESIGRQQFIEAEEPDTDELRRVVRAMNRLSQKIKGLLATEKQHVERLRTSLQSDDLTRLANRKVFMQTLEELLSNGPADQEHGLLMLRIVNLAEINQRFGRKQTDQLLQGLADILRKTATANAAPEEALPARLNGSDFVVLFHGKPDFEQILPEVNRALASIKDFSTEQLPIVMAAEYLQGDAQRAQVMIRADNLLAKAEVEWPTQPWLLASERQQTDARSVDQWRSLLHDALAAENTALDVAGVYDTAGELACEDLNIKLVTPDAELSALQFRPWARRFGLESEFDQRLLTDALARLAKNPELRINIRLSREAVSSVNFLSAISTQLKHSPDQVHRLTLAIKESTALADPESFASFARVVSELGSRAALVDASAAFLSSDLLPSLGLAFLHLDTNLTTDLTANSKEELFLQRICSVAHSVGMKVLIDEPGPEEKQQAEQCGVDGFRAIR
ncbi:MAG: LapD/MoxY N-terminal periplasmic domain-containing protein [Marinobacter sp.]|nr:LapD/MoxY N-terminal periplasmic domain-containing protein [Marinobacter sp.]